MIKLIGYISLFLLSVQTVLLAVERPVTYSDARVMAMGNAFCAVADDKNMLFFNPAGFATYGLIETSKLEAILDPTLWRSRYNNIGDLTIFSVSAGMNDQILDKQDSLTKLNDMDFWNKFSDGTLTYDEAIEANKYLSELYYTRLRPTVNAEFFSYARHYFGFGVFNSTAFSVDLQPAGFFPSIKLDINSDTVLPIGFGMPVPGQKEWSMGITYKYFHRVKAYADDLGDFAVIQEYMGRNYFIDSDVQKSFMDQMLEGPDSQKAIDQLKGGTGHGFDLGLLYRPVYAWKFGLLLSDVYTRIRWWDNSEPSQIPMNARIGAAWTPNFDMLIFSDPILSSDIEDVFHQQEKNLFLKWHFGAEIKVLFELFAVRAGINDGYLSYGAGFDLNFSFISKIPGLKWLRPNQLYFPKFDPKDREFAYKNPFCCCLTALLAPLTYAHIKVDVTSIGYELGEHPGQIMDRQWIGRLSLSYSY